jgi:Flp pilus assembly secretin CpaC
MTRIIARSVFAAALCGACATVAPLPNNRLAATEASYRGAQEAGADSVPRAKLYLKYSDEEIILARKLMSEQKAAEAGQVLDRARADAELSLGLTRAAQAESEAQHAADQIKTLRASP